MTQPSSIQLENRSCTITVGTVSVSNIGLQTGLDIWFQVKRSLKPGVPNTCNLRLTNLADATRSQIEASTTGTVAAITSKGSAKKAPTTKAAAAATVPVTVTAGYVGGTSVLFAGQLRSAQTTIDGPDTITELTTGDGDEAALLARSVGAFGKGSNPYLVAQAVIDDMGCGPGNLATYAATLKSSTMFSGGVILKGNSLDRLIAIASGCGLEVTLQQGILQWSKLGKPTGISAYVLSSTDGNTGLVGSPTIDTNGLLSLQTLMLPGITPGAPIRVKAKYVQGDYRIISIETTGDTAGGDWGHALEAKLYGLGVG